MSAVVIENLSAGYGDLAVIRDVSLSFALGECVGIIGPNGAGKTTFIKAICGLCTTLAGTVKVQGTAFDRLSAAARIREGVQLVPEGRQLFPSLTVRDNITIGAPASLGRADLLIRQALKLLPELEPVLSRKVSSLSGGQQQMVAVARSAVRSPKLLLMDEPTQGLSPINAKRIYDAVGSMKGTVPMIVVEQGVEYITRVCDRLFIMQHGTLAEVPDHRSYDQAQLARYYFGATHL